MSGTEIIGLLNVWKSLTYIYKQFDMALTRLALTPRFHDRSTPLATPSPNGRAGA